MAVIEKERLMTGAVPVSGSAGVWAWFVQRVTGAVLLVFLGAHFWVLHYATAGEHIRLADVMHRLNSPFFMIVDSALLATALYHGLNGVRMIFFDLGLGRWVNKTFSIVLWTIGLVTLVYGTNTLVYLISGNALFYLK